MKFSYQWLQSYFEEKLPEPDKLAELLTMHSFEIEDVKDVFLDIKVLPNRVADCSAYLGIAQEITAILGYKIKEPNFKPQADQTLKTEDYIKVEVKEPELCPRYMAVLIKGVEVKESPDWMKSRLKEIGQKPINNIVDAVNYAMLETGQPMHAFDLDKIGGGKIIVRKAKAGEKVETLDNKQVELTEEMLVIADADKALGIAGIKGGKEAGITDQTKDIVIEAAVFNGPCIRKTSAQIKIKTDASYRFEHGISMFLPEVAIQRVSALIQEVAGLPAQSGGSVADSVLDVCAGKPVLKEIVLKEEDVFKLLGIEIKPDEIIKILKSLNFEIKKEGENFLVKPPFERTDINIKEDLIEEVARIYGYKNTPSVLPGESKIPPEKNEEYIYSNWIRGVLSNLGFTEVYNYSFTDEGTHELELANPISKEKSYLRENLSKDLKVSVEENLKNFEKVRFFEIGKVFFPEEKTCVAIAIGGRKNKKEEIKAEMRGVADDLFIKDADRYIKDNVLEIELNEILEVAKENGLDLVEIVNFETKEVEYKPFSKYPAMIRDISLFVPADTQIVEVMDKIENTAGLLLIDTDLFDEFQKPGEDRKSLAFRLVFQSFDKTLTDGEVNEIMEKIFKALEENINWEIRR